MSFRMALPRTPRHREDERGFTLVLVALVLTGLMIIAAIAIDGGDSYAVRRSMQNSSDAASMAGAQALYKAQIAGLVTLDSTLTGVPWPTATDCSTPSSIPTTDVYTQVYCTAIARDGGSLPTNGDDFCDVIDVNGNTLGKCYDPTLSPPESYVLNGSAVGVKVETENSRQTFFGGIAGQSTAMVHAVAAASVQPIAGSGDPYIVCGWSGTNPNDGNVNVNGYNLIDHTTGRLYDDSVLLPTYGKNGTNGNPPNANGPSAPAAMIFEENSPQDKDHDMTCAASSSSSDGQGQSGGITATGGFVAGSSGNGANNNANPGTPIGSQYTPCGSDVSATALPNGGCDLVLPIADYGVGAGTNVSYHIADFGVFHIQPGSGNQKVVGWYDGHAQITTGFTSQGTCPPASGTCIVKLADFPTNGLVE